MKLNLRAGSTPALGTNKNQQDMTISTYTIDETLYLVRGAKPTLLILSGTHGDEPEVDTCVTRYIDTHQSNLPDYVYIPKLSPSAVELKTRRNKYGNDLNREFIQNPTDLEVITAMKILEPFSFSLCIAFHEDPDRRTSFYMYDTDHMSDEQLLTYRNGIIKTGAKLFTGIDDPADKKLALHVEKGYIYSPMINAQDTGFSMRWLIADKKAKRVFNPEIPGKADRDLKQRLVDSIFEFSKTFIE